MNTYEFQNSQKHATVHMPGEIQKMVNVLRFSYRVVNPGLGVRSGSDCQKKNPETKGKPQKKLFFDGPATERGGGKGLATKKKLFLKL